MPCPKRPREYPFARAGRRLVRDTSRMVMEEIVPGVVTWVSPLVEETAPAFTVRPLSQVDKEPHYDLS